MWFEPVKPPSKHPHATIPQLMSRTFNPPVSTSGSYERPKLKKPLPASPNRSMPLFKYVTCK